MRRIAKIVKVRKKIAEHNAVVKFHGEGILKNRKRSGLPRAFSSREDRAMHRVVACSSNEFLQKHLSEADENLERTKTIQRRLSLEFSLKSCKSARKPRLMTAIKKKRMNYAKRPIS